MSSSLFTPRFPNRRASFLVTWEKHHYVSLYGNCSINEMFCKSLFFQLRTKAGSLYFLSEEEREATGAAGGRFLGMSVHSPAGLESLSPLSKEHKRQSWRADSFSFPERQCQCRTFQRVEVPSQISGKAAGRCKVGCGPNQRYSVESDWFLVSWDPYSINVWWFDDLSIMNSFSILVILGYLACLWDILYRY